MVIIFYGWLCSSLAVVPKIEIGLDQEISMPDDSFVLKYFNFLNEYLSVGKSIFNSILISKLNCCIFAGPPFYVVINSTHLNFDYAEPNNTNKVCGTSNCNENSLQNTINIWSKFANQTRVASPAMSWVDDYVNYLSSTSKCCMFFEKNHSTVYSEEWNNHAKNYKSKISTYIGTYF